MYSVLLVDDEPLILSGIRHMINWEQAGFRLIGGARNGKQALEIIEDSHPDIVVCDINMPGMSGLDLLRAASEGANAPAFVMLTNHGEFDMARIALQYKAVDYLLKSQLDEEALLAAMDRAKAFCDQREAALDARDAKREAPKRRERVIAYSVLCLMERGMEGERASESLENLRKAGVLARFAWLQIVLDYSPIPDVDAFSEEDIARVYDSVHDIADALIARVFERCAALPREEEHGTITFFCWSVDRARYDELVRVLFTQLTSSVASLTPTRVRLLASSCLESEAEMALLIGEKRALRQHAYLFPDALVTAPVTLPELKRISPEDICGMLIPALRAKNAQQCAMLFKKARAELRDTPHSRHNGIEYCAQLYSTAATLLAPILGDQQSGAEPLSIASTIRRLNSFVNREQLLGWLDAFERLLLFQLERLSSERPALVEEVRGYVQEHIDKQIKLSDVAQHVSMAPSYLSTTFRKLYGKTLFHYVNEVKIQQACSYLDAGTHKIYEISYMLGYESAYYFTRVFKRYVGMTPREYQARFSAGTDE